MPTKNSQACDPKQFVCFQDSLETLSKTLSQDAIRAWLWYQRAIGKPWLGSWAELDTVRTDEELKQLLAAGQLAIDPEARSPHQLVPAPLYYAGDIYFKISLLKEAKGNPWLTDELRMNQLGELERAKPATLGLSDPNPANRLMIHPRADFTSQFQIESLATGDAFDKPLTLKQAFMVWIEKLPASEFKLRVTGAQIIRYYFRGGSMTDIKPEDRERVKREVPMEAFRLFQRFLHEIITREDQLRLVYEWNARYNAFRDINPDLIPVAFTHNRYFGKGQSPAVLRESQREGVAFALSRGSAIIAYDVGVGKTLTAIALLGMLIEAGVVKRPMVVTPKAVYHKWIREINGEEKSDIQGLLPHVPINDLYNLGEEYMAKVLDADGYAQQLPAGSITMVTYEGFAKLGLRNETYDKLKPHLHEIIQVVEESEGTGKSERRKAAVDQKIENIFGRSQGGTSVELEDLGIDYMVVDEAHNFKAIFSAAKGSAGGDDDAMESLPGVYAANRKQGSQGKEGRNEYEIRGDSSSRGIRLFLHSLYLGSIGGGMCLLSATPFTNSPLEIYSMLSLVAYRELRDRGINNLKEFFDTFIKVTHEMKWSARQKLELAQVIKGFNNRLVLQNILFSYINYKTGADAGILTCGDAGTEGQPCRPRKVVLPMLNQAIGGQVVPLPASQQVSTLLPPTPRQRKYMEEISEYARKRVELYQICTSAAGTCSSKEPLSYEEMVESSGENDKGRTLRAISYQQNLSLSPFLYNCADLGAPESATEFVRSGPKMEYVMKCISSVKEWHEERGERPSGQVIYANIGVCYFPLLAQYLVEVVGYKEEEVAIIEGSNARIGKKSANRELIKDKFNNGEVLVLIGSASIREGIDLQRRGSVLYLLTLDWNPTDVKQLEGTDA